MAFKSKTPGKGLSRSTPLQTKAPLKAGTGLEAKALSVAEQRKFRQQAMQKSTLRALERAKHEALERGINLSEWESEFIDSVSQRVRTYGRAFADPDKGAMNGTLSARQGVKLREIRRKAQRGKAQTEDEQ